MEENVSAGDGKARQQSDAAGLAQARHRVLQTGVECITPRYYNRYPIYHDRERFCRVAEPTCMELYSLHDQHEVSVGPG